MEVLKLPVEGPPASSAASAPNIASVTPATTAAAIAATDKGLGGATARGEPPEKRQALNAVPNAPAPPPPPPSSSEPEGDVLQQVRSSSVFSKEAPLLKEEITTIRAEEAR